MLNFVPDPSAIAELWDIATKAGYDHAVIGLRMAARMPEFHERAAALTLAAVMLDKLKAATSDGDTLINDSAARELFFDILVSMQC